MSNLLATDTPTTSNVLLRTEKVAYSLEVLRDTYSKASNWSLGYQWLELWYIMVTERWYIYHNWRGQILFYITSVGASFTHEQSCFFNLLVCPYTKAIQIMAIKKTRTIPTEEICLCIDIRATYACAMIQQPGWGCINVGVACYHDDNTLIEVSKLSMHSSYYYW